MCMREETIIIWLVVNLKGMSPPCLAIYNVKNLKRFILPHSIKLYIQIDDLIFFL